MLKVMHGIDKIEIWFDHKFCTPHEIKSTTGIVVNSDRRCSLATISRNGKIVDLGIAICHPIDNFCRAIGRKKALTNALRSSNKELRKAVWDVYQFQCGF